MIYLILIYFNNNSIAELTLRASGQILIIQNDPWLKDATLKLYLSLFCHHFRAT